MAAFTVIAVKIKLTPFLDTVHVHISRHNMPPLPTSGDFTSKWVTRVMGFLPANFQLPICYPPILDFGSCIRDRRTDRQTDGQTTMALWGHNK